MRGLKNYTNEKMVPSKPIQRAGHNPKGHARYLDAGLQRKANRGILQT